MKRMPTMLTLGGALVCASAWLIGGNPTRTAQASEIVTDLAGAPLPRAGLPGPAESPGGADGYKWSYPKKVACGKLSGTTECKSRPTIESSEDEKKRAECEPTKGDLCLCD